MNPSGSWFYALVFFFTMASGAGAERRVLGGDAGRVHGGTL